MITIKFRGKDIATGEWRYGSLLVHRTHAPHIVDCTGRFPDVKTYTVKSDTVGQFSTLRDKKGKEIYEGDILRAGEEKTLLEVRFVRGVFAFLWNGDLDDEFPCNAPTQEWAEVVGNIHDNPKMIKRK